MATANSTRRSAGSSLSAQSDEFDRLFRRLLVAFSHVRLVSQHFGDLSSLCAEDAAAGITLYEAAHNLDRLHNELDSWYVRHEHAPKSPGTQIGLGVFTDDESARTPLTELPPALPCPFCGRHDDIMVSQTNAAREHGKWYHVSCGTCGADAPGGETLLQAAHGWNGRPHSAAVATSEPIAEADSVAVTALPPIGMSDKTADRIRAFLLSVRPLSGVADVDGGDGYQHGRVLIERMAMSTKDGDYPSIKLSPAHCADVLCFLSSIEPFEPATWWSDPKDSPSHIIGFVFVLRTLERSLRSKGTQS